MQNGKFNTDLPVIIKILIMAGMVLFLIIPLMSIQLLIAERSKTRDKSEQEITQSWGGAQCVTGLMISVPYMEKDAMEFMVFMPDTLSVSGTLEPFLLHRGIYSAAVYNADLAVAGSFSVPDFRGVPVMTGAVRWDLARVLLSLTGPLGLRETVAVTVNGKTKDLSPEREHKGPYSFTLSAPLDLTHLVERREPIAFSLDLKLKGGRSLSFVPVAESTDVTLSSGWRDPSFFG